MKWANTPTPIAKVRLDKVIAGEDSGGIIKAANWKGGGGYRFFELALTLINRDAFGEEIMSIVCRSYDQGLEKAYRSIAISKVPQMLLKRCEFGRSDYSLNIVHPPTYDDGDE